MAVKRRKSIRLVESCELPSKPRIDEDKGIVYDVKILGFKSVHGYSYTPTAMKKAISLYENKPINVNHHESRRVDHPSRPYGERFGRVRGVHYKEGKGLYGNVHYNPGHQLAKQFVWDAKHAPENCGLSHIARGSQSVRNGEVFVESIYSVRSVDLVADPATNASLFEDKGGAMRVKVRRSKKAKARRRAKLIESLRNQIEDADDSELMDLFEAAVASDEAPTSATPQEAMGKMIEAIWMDTELDLEQKREKINRIIDLAAEEEESGDESSSAATEEEDTEEDIPEDRGPRMKRSKNGKTATPKKKPPKGELIEDVSDIREELASLKKQKRIEELCEDAGFRPTKIQKKALLGLEKASEVKSLIESFMGGEERTPVTEKKPKSGSKKPSDKTVDLKDFAEGLLMDDEI